MLLVFNPKAGQGTFVQKLYDVISIFSRAGYQVEVYPTFVRGNAQTYIQEYGSNFDLIVCSGGDGTMNEALNAYMCIENPPKIAYIPSGTVNDFASTLKLPKDVIKSAHSIINGHPRLIDVGVLGKQYFSYVAAFGIFTNISYTTDQKAKNILGRTAYFLEGIKRLGKIPATDCVIKFSSAIKTSSAASEDEVIEGKFILGVITNSTSIAGFNFNAKKSIAIDDGLFEVIFVRKPNNPIEHMEIITTLRNARKNSNLVIKRRASKIEFSSTQACDWTVDGEFGGKYDNVTIKNLHKKLNIVLPHSLN